MWRSRWVQLVVTSSLLAAAWTAIVPVENAGGQLLRQGPSRVTVSGTGRTSSSGRPAQAYSLEAFVRVQQERFVRPSFSETDCFTWDDLTFLRESISSGEIAKLIQKDEDFAPVCDALKQTSSARREASFRAASRIYRRTWAQMGRIDPTGQTDAGQKGDILVGSLVVSLVRQQVAQQAKQESSPVPQFKVGDKLHAIRDRTRVQVGTDIVATLNSGQEVTVIAVNGSWVGVTVARGDREIQGWIQPQYLAASTTSETP